MIFGLQLVDYRDFDTIIEKIAAMREKLAQCVMNENTADMRALVTQALSLGVRMISPMSRSGI